MSVAVAYNDIYAEEVTLRTVSKDSDLMGSAKRLREAWLDHKNESEYGMTADMARLCQVSPPAVSKWLNGQSKPSARNYAIIAKYCRVDVSWLIYGTGTPREDEEFPVEEGDGSVVSAGATLVNIEVETSLGEDGIVTLKRTKQVRAYLPEGVSVVAYQIADSSLAPRLRRGEVVLATKDRNPEAGDDIIIEYAGGEPARLFQFIGGDDMSMAVGDPNNPSKREFIDTDDVASVLVRHNPVEM